MASISAGRPGRGRGRQAPARRRGEGGGMSGDPARANPFGEDLDLSFFKPAAKRLGLERGAD